MRRTLLASLLAVATIAAGCGGGGGEETRAGPGPPEAGGGGALSYAIPGPVTSLDPLEASSRGAQLVSRQVHEPLVEELTGPYGDTRRQPGLAVSWKPSRDRTIWTFRLRPGVLFQDGTPFNAAAALANTRRWRSLPAGRKLVPKLFAVDAPRPDEIRFILDAPVADLPQRLSSPRLGIVAPGALRARGGERAKLKQPSQSGTGPFEINRQGDSSAYLQRNAGWWGSAAGLGPALDGIEFRFVPNAAERARLLLDGEVQVADELTGSELRAVERDPLLTALSAGDSGLGLERSVRGIESATAVPSLSAAWLTTVGAEAGGG